MSDSTGHALAVRDATAPLVPLAPINDAELAVLFRTARALAESGMFKDSTQPGQAFAKMLAGRDLGLTPFESMSSLHVIEGKIEASADLHATKVREREGYDFRVAWLKIDQPPQGNQPGKVSAVWADEEEIADLRDTFGCAIVFYENVPPGGKAQDGEQRGISRWTIKDSEAAELTAPRGKGTSNHLKYGRNMFYARAMTNGVAWFVPEVMGGVRVYGHGEIPRDTGEDLTAGAGDPRTTSTVQAAKSLPIEVEAIIARAAQLGHAGLSNRDAAAMIVGSQSDDYVRTWIRNATGELNRMASGRPSAPVPEPEIPDAVVVEPEPEGESDAAIIAEARKAMGERLAELDDRIKRAGEDASVDPDDTAGLEAEAASIRAQLNAASDPAQTDLGV